MDEGELFEIYSNLRPYVPCGIESKLIRVDIEGDEVSKQVVFINRQIIYLYGFQNRYVVNKQLISDRELLTSATSFPYDALKFLEPLEVQSITVLIWQILAKPSDFAQRVYKSAGTPSFSFLIELTIPAVYGFFSTQETSACAYNFYSAISMIAPYDIFVWIVSPFFKSATVNHFSDAVFRDALSSNYLPKSAEIQLAQSIIDISAKRMNFLPESHNALLRFLSTIYKPSQIWMLILKVLVVPQFLLKIPLSPYFHANSPCVKFEKVLHILRDADKFSEIRFPQLSLNQSLFEIPEAFLSYGQSLSYDLVLTLNDVYVLATIEPMLTQDSPKILNVVLKNKNQVMLPWKIKYYPKKPRPPFFSLRPLVFDCIEIPKPLDDNENAQIWQMLEEECANYHMNPFDVLSSPIAKTGVNLLDYKLNHMDRSKLKIYGLKVKDAELTRYAIIFEDLLIHQMQFHKLRTWLEIGEECVGMFGYMIAAREYMQNYINMKPKVLLNNFWKILNDQPKIKSERLWLSIQLLSKLEPAIINPHKKVIDDLNNKYSRIMLKYQSRIRKGIEFTSDALTQCMWESSGILTFVNASSPLRSRYIALITYLYEIQKLIYARKMQDSLQEIDAIIHFTFTTGHFDWVLETVILLDGVFFNDPRFNTNCDDELIDIWKQFTVAFIHLLQEDEELLSIYAKYATSGMLQLP